MPPAKDLQPAGLSDPTRSSDRPSCALDDPAVIAVVQQYRAALEEGGRPDRQELLAEYPEIAGELAACLDALEFVQQVAPQLRQQVIGDDGDGPKSGQIHPLATLGDFRIEREIGRGGMGVVYEATQLSLGRRVALKVLPFAAVLDQRQLQRFKNEAQAAASLDHPSIVHVHSVACDRGVHYYAMQYIEGKTLAEVVSEGIGARGEGLGVAGVDGHRREALVGEPPESHPQSNWGLAPLDPSHPTDSPPHPVTPSSLTPSGEVSVPWSH